MIIKAATLKLTHRMKASVLPGHHLNSWIIKCYTRGLRNTVHFPKVSDVFANWWMLLHLYWYEGPVTLLLPLFLLCQNQGGRLATISSNSTSNLYTKYSWEMIIRQKVDKLCPKISSFHISFGFARFSKSHSPRCSESCLTFCSAWCLRPAWPLKVN